MPKILFYIERDLHLPYLVPVMEELKKEPSVQAAFCAPEFIPSSGYKPGRGVPEDKLKQLREKAPVYDDPRDFSPDVTVVGDSCQFLLPEHPGPTVNVGHGLICKGTFYTERPHSRRDNLSSVICVPGPWHKKRLEKQVKIPIEMTGFIKTDQLVKNTPEPRKDFNEYYGLHKDAANILYAPTFNSDLTSLPWILPRLESLADKNTNVLIKLHNMTPQNFFDSCRGLAQHPGIALLDDVDYPSMMHHSDMMISDVSSMFVEFMLLDKPVVLFRRPDLQMFNTFDCRDIEYRVRDAVDETGSPDGLLDMAKNKLENPHEKSSLRKKYRRALDYKRDGKSAKRAAKTVLETLDRASTPKSRSRKRFLVIVDAEGSSTEQTEKSLLEIKNAGFEQKMDVLVVGENSSEKEKDDSGLPFKAVCEKIKETSADFIVLLQAGFCLPYKWAEHMSLHVSWEKEAGLIRALGQKEIADSTLNFFKFEDAEKMPPSTSAHLLRTVGIGSKGTGVCGPSACVLVPAPKVKEMLAGACPSTPAKLCGDLHRRIGSEQTITALDVYVHPGPDTKSLPPRY